MLLKSRSGGGHIPWVEDERTATNGQVTFILSRAPNDLNSFEFYVNGILVEDTSDYVVSGVTVTWLNTEWAMESTDRVILRYQ
jgi:hypothetical protein